MGKSQSEWFDEVVKQTLSRIEEVLLIKGKEYRRDNNVFHNFEVAAEMNRTTREKALYGFALKHHVSISDIRNDIEKGILPSVSAVEEKYNDAIIYLLLEKASVLDRIKNQNK